MSEQMSIEQKMIFVQRALELGAKVELKFHNCRAKEAAKEVICQISELSNIPYAEMDNEGAHWFNLKSKNHDFTATAFFDGKEEEEIA